jgi:methionine-gamma-lyase
MARDLDPATARPATLAIHGGERPDPATGASSPNIVMSSTYVSDKPEGFSAYELTENSPFLYGRWANPSVRALEEKMALLEGAEAATCYASGMAAASAILLSLLSNGDHVILPDVCYAGIAELGRDTLPRFGVSVSRVNTARAEDVAAAMRPETKLVFIDTPCNPLIRLTDIAEVARIAHEGGALVAVDNTFASPIGTKPLSLGADLVMHSLTKYVGGHGDAMGGCVCGTSELIRRLIIEANVHHGGVMSPFNAWLIARGASTLPLRMRAHQEGAMALGQFLESHPSVEAVMYPGLPSHPQHTLAAAQMENFSGMMTFRVKGDGRAAAAKIAEGLKIAHYAVSLGHHRTLVFYMPTDDLLSSSFQLDAAQEEDYRRFAGDGVFRLSVGLEDPADLIADFDAVL